MPHSDQFGTAVSTTSEAALGHYDRAVWNLLTLSNDPVADVTAATTEDPSLVMGHCLTAMLNLLGTDKALLPAANDAINLAKAHAKSASPREQAHITALQAFARGGFGEATEHWERILVETPTDVLAMYAAHQGDFFLGVSSELRDRVARRLGSLPAGWKGTGFYRGMHAFGLEEMNQYQAAEDAGRAAVGACPRDAWAIHAVTHCMEMTARVDEGIRFLDERKADWAVDNFFQVHNWWHLGLYLLDQGKIAEALALYDEKIAPGSSPIDKIDGSALLWRLTIHGHAVGDRWTALANYWEPRIDDAWYGFNDTHAMMAFAASGRRDLVERLLAVMQRTASLTSENARLTKTVSLPVARAIAAFSAGKYAEVVDLLRPIRTIAWHGGGSHAQRDLINQTLIRAAELGGDRRLTESLLNERLAMKPASHFNRLWRERALKAA